MRRSQLVLTLAAFTCGALLTALLLRPELREFLGLRAATAAGSLYAPRDWRRGKPSKLNISVYVFGDRNRNGVYDLGDKPLNRIAVRLTRPDGSTRLARSNINGYANFAMHSGGDEADISLADRDYVFEVLPPPYWVVTTDNASQMTAFSYVAGSVSGLGAQLPPAAVGLAPPGRLRGNWPRHAGTSLRATAALAETTAAPERAPSAKTFAVGESGAFEVALGPGLWTIHGASDEPATRRAQTAGSQNTDADGATPARRVAVGFAPVVLSAGATGGGPAAATVGTAGLSDVIVNFDDNLRSFIEKLPAGYAGLRWDYLLAVDNQYYKGPGYINGLMSGSRVAYNSSGHPVTISALDDARPFDFVGGYFSVAWHNAEGETLIARAWRGEQQVAEERFNLSHLAPVYFQADFRGITRLRLETEHYWQFVVDDLHFRVPGDN